MPAPKAMKPTTVNDSNPHTYEAQHVHAIYDQIAPHFSSTRYKPWPIITTFLSTLPPGSLGLDSGTGNGKYLSLPSSPGPGSVYTIGLDRSAKLLEIARGGEEGRREVVWGDVVGAGWRVGGFDYAISIATIHHLSTHSRRKLAVQRLLQCVSPSHGRVLIYVWAVEQDELSKRAVPTSTSAHTPDGNRGVDVFVPWVLSNGNASKSNPANEASENQDPPRVFDRFYHMFAKGELTELVREAAAELGLFVGGKDKDGEAGLVHESGVEIVQDGWERSNYYVELRRWRR